MPRQRSIFEFRTSKVSSFVDLTTADDEIVGDLLVETNARVDSETQLNSIGAVFPSDPNKLSLVDQDIFQDMESETKLNVDVDLDCSEQIKYKGKLEFGNQVQNADLAWTRSDVKQESDSTPYLEEITCPVCNLNIASLLLESRVVHVEACLIPKEIEIKPLLPLKPVKKRKPEVDRYKNSQEHSTEQLLDLQSNTSSSKPIKVPTSIKRGKVTRPIPEVKLLSFNGVTVSVDAFSYANDPSIQHHFLTHFHSDHYGGISKNWCYERVFPLDEICDSRYRKIIYCTSITSKLLTLRFSIDPRFIQELEFDVEVQVTGNLYVKPITANHCPGAAIFLFRNIDRNGKDIFWLHCGDFRVNQVVLSKLEDFHVHSVDTDSLKLDRVYLDTTYCKPIYNFPKQDTVCNAVLDMFEDLVNDDALFADWFGALKQHRITDFFMDRSKKKKKKKFLILVGTYVIGKENLAIAILKRLNCQIYVSTINSRDDKRKILGTYGDEYLNLVLCNRDIGDHGDDEAVIHLVPMQIAGNLEEMCRYFNHNSYFESFERCVGLRPTGWTFQVDRRNNGVSFGVDQLVDLMKVVPQYLYKQDILPQGLKINGKRAKQDHLLYRIYLLPYLEHSLFRELSYFCSFLKIDRVIPTVNIEHEKNVQEMAELIGVWAKAREAIARREIDIGVEEL